MVKNQFVEKQNERIETTGTVHTGIQVSGAQVFHGRPIVAFGGKFSPEVAFELLQRHQVTHSFLGSVAIVGFGRKELRH